MTTTIFSDRSTYLLNSAASGSGSGVDMRSTLPYGMIQHVTLGASSLVRVQGSIDATGWLTIETYTATTTTATAQWSGYYPYLRGVAHLIYSGGAAGTLTGTTYFYLAPGVG